MSELPAGAWQNLSLDFCGPLPTCESLLVIQDEYSRYPVVEIICKTSIDSVIPVVDKVFAEFGYPKVIKTDNGPQFRSATWKNFLTHCGVKHRKITPLWPRSNSQAEAFNKPLLKSIRSAKTGAVHISAYVQVHTTCHYPLLTPLFNVRTRAQNQDASASRTVAPPNRRRATAERWSCQEENEDCC